MNTHPDDLLPFYLNRTLSAEEGAAVERHLEACPDCRARLVEWRKLSGAVSRSSSQSLAGERAALPLLSPLVAASLRRRPALQEAVHAAAHLIWTQRHILVHEWMLPFLAGFIMLAFLASFISWGQAVEWVIFPFVAVFPLAAVLLTALLHISSDDPAYEIIAAAPTSPGTLILARQTLAVGVLSLLALVGSGCLAVIGEPAPPLFHLIATWLGPVLLLSALATVLSLRLHPQAAAAILLILWGGILILLASEQAGAPVVRISLMWLLHPGWAILLIETLLAGLLWLGSWLWLAWKEAGPLSPVGS
jgi:hypothetical protein